LNRYQENNRTEIKVADWWDNPPYRVEQRVDDIIQNLSEAIIRGEEKRNQNVNNYDECKKSKDQLN